MRDQLLDTAKFHFKSHIHRHRMNIEIMLANPTAIHDHTDWMAAMEAELGKMADYHDKLEVLTTYFNSTP